MSKYIFIIAVFFLGPSVVNGAEDDFDAALAGFKDPFVSPISTAKKVAPPVVIKKEPEPVKLKEPIASESSVLPVLVNPPVLKISGLVWNSAKPQAIINGKVVSVGGFIDNAIQLVGVRRNEIDIIFQGRNFTIPYMNKNDKK